MRFHYSLAATAAVVTLAGVGRAGAICAGQYCRLIQHVSEHRRCRGADRRERAAGQSAATGTAVATGANLNVFTNSSVDSSFGVTSAINITQYAPNGTSNYSLALPAAARNQAGGIVTSFPSKSELGLTLSQDRHSFSFMGYAAPVGALDVSNTATPDSPEATNP